MKKCRVYKSYCSKHGFVHGAEAEELRKGIETVMERWRADGTGVPLFDLQRLLDRVDARDSLAYREAKD